MTVLNVEQTSVESMDELLSPLGLTTEKIKEMKENQKNEMMSWFPKELHKTEFIDDIYKLASNYFDKNLSKLTEDVSDNEEVNDIKSQINDIELSIFVCEELAIILKKNFNLKKLKVVRDEVNAINKNLIRLKVTFNELKDHYNKINLARQNTQTDIEA